jgi:membrane protein insertase Oxa1/YidC/SpoIIIJ
MGVGVAVLFSVMMFFWPLPSAFVLYWVFTNVFATTHMLYAYRQPLPPLQKVNAPNGGVFPFGNVTGTNGAAPKNGVSKSNGTPKVRTGTPVKHRPKKKK